ncbi:MAG: phenylalanine--tRNA ligase subunit beta [Patescibacteria group bacterium]
MKFSYNWLKELVEFKESPQELADLINTHITEVETLEGESGGYMGVIVAEILQIDAHPNADKLHLVTLNIGLGKRVTVVCGADNIEVGQKVPLALVGAKLPVGEIKATIIRGVESTGMICSGEELGIACPLPRDAAREKKSEGILVLDKKASVGRPVQEYLQIADDSILDLKILSNRPDYSSYVGLAREISAVLGRDVSLLPLPLLGQEGNSSPAKGRLGGDGDILKIKLDYPEDASTKTSDKVLVNVADPKLCRKYLAHYVANVEVKESPDWLQQKLISSGIRPISNIVDISNYVMLELGQPVHAFDADKILRQAQDDKRVVVVRRAKSGEKMLALDGKTYELNPEVTVIADSENPIALAGIMGSEHSGVTDITRDIVVEVATFDPVTIRRGGKSLGLSTDASIRFERGLQPYLADLAMKRVLNLIHHIIPEAKIATGNVEMTEPSVPNKSIEFKAEDISDFIGTKITSSDISKILQRLSFDVKASGKNMSVTPPPWRNDVQEMADVAEEVVRIWGIDKVVPAMPEVIMTAPIPNTKLRRTNELKDLLARCGFAETPSHPFIGADWAGKLGFSLDDGLKISNPLNSQWTHLVSNLWPNLLGFARNAGNEPIKIFEIANVFLPPDPHRHSGELTKRLQDRMNKSIRSWTSQDDEVMNALSVQHDGKGIISDAELPVEIPLLSMLVSGKNEEAYRTLRGIVESIVANVPKIKFVAIPGSAEDHFINVLRVMSEREIIGTIEEVSPRLANEIDVPEGTVWAEVNLQKLMELGQGSEKYCEISKFPSSQFDISVELSASVSVGLLIDEIWLTSSLIQAVDAFDVYQLPTGGRSIGLRITLQAMDRTLTDAEIKTLESKIINLIVTQYRGKVRG